MWRRAQCWHLAALPCHWQDTEEPRPACAKVDGKLSFIFLLRYNSHTTKSFSQHSAHYVLVYSQGSTTSTIYFQNSFITPKKEPHTSIHSPSHAATELHPVTSDISCDQHPSRSTFSKSAPPGHRSVPHSFSSPSNSPLDGMTHFITHQSVDI